MPIKKTAKAGPKPVASDAPVIEEVGETATLRLKDLIDKVVVISGAKKKDAKSVVDAMLRVLGDALAAGENLILPPLGRLHVNRTKQLVSGDVMIVKLKRTDAGKGRAKARQETLAAHKE